MPAAPISANLRSGEAAVAGPARRWAGRRGGLPVDQLDRGDEPVAVLGHRLDETRVGGVVAELPAKRLDALGQRFVGHRNAAPHFVEETVLRHQFARLADQQPERVEIARIELHRRIVAPQLAVARVEREAVEAEAAHVSVLGQCAARLPAISPAINRQLPAARDGRGAQCEANDDGNRTGQQLAHSTRIQRDHKHRRYARRGHI